MQRMFSPRQVRFAHQPKGRPGRLLLAGFAALGCLALTVQSAVAVDEAADLASALQTQSHTVSVELNAAQSSAAELIGVLRDAGFPDAAIIKYASGRNIVLSVPVASADDATLGLLRSLPGVKAARRQFELPGIPMPIVQTNQIMLKARPGVSEQEVRDLAVRENCEYVKKMGIKVAIFVLRINEDGGDDATTVAKRLAGSGLFEWAEPDLYIPTSPRTIDDPLFQYQWHLQNTGQTGGRPGADVKAVDAWNTTEGDGAVVAILDEAIDWQHPDLVDAAIAQHDFVHDDPDPTPQYPAGALTDFGTCVIDECQFVSCWGMDAHGTACAGLAAGQANDIGVRGVAPRAGLIAVEMLNAPGTGMVDAFYFAESNGAQVISNSWGINAPPVWVGLALRTAIDDVATNGRGGLGCLVLFASGNSSLPIRKSGGESGLASVMAIGATRHDDTLSCYSNFGEETSVVAPGGGGGGTDLTGADRCGEANMATTDMRVPELDPGSVLCYTKPTSFAGYNPPPAQDSGFPIYEQDNFADQSYNRRFNGTSAACPVAAGAATLVFSVAPSMTAEQVRNVIEHTADRVQTEGGGFDPVTGHSVRYGHGRINADRAVRAAQDGRTWPSPVGSLQNDSIAAYTQLGWTVPANDVVGVLVVRASGTLNFSPIDGREYSVGELVTANTRVVANDYLTRYADSDTPAGEVNYGVFTYNTDLRYSWGRRASMTSKPLATAPLASVTASPSAGNAPLTILFAGGAVDPQNRPIVAYSWDFGDSTTGSGSSIEHTYNLPGQYLVKLTVRNTVNATGLATVLVTVLDPSAGPGALFTASLVTSPASGAPSLPVMLSARINGNGAITRYEWNFGDGSAAVSTTEPTATHTYVAPGSYVATVTAIDGQGLSSRASASVVVSDDDNAAAKAFPLVGTCGAGIAPTMLLLAASLLGVKHARRRLG